MCNKVKQKLIFFKFKSLCVGNISSGFLCIRVKICKLPIVYIYIHIYKYSFENKNNNINDSKRTKSTHRCIPVYDIYEYNTLYILCEHSRVRVFDIFNIYTIIILIRSIHLHNI